MGQQLSRNLPGNLKKRNRTDLDSNLVFPEGFKWVEGRAYRDEKSLTLINAADDKEITQWTAQHYLWRFVMQGNFQAPITKELKRGIKVLDVGCGSGVWTLEMAAQFPRSQFFGTDIKPLYPSAPTQPNCHFRIVDTLKGLPFDDDTFDYVFQRSQALSYPEKTWPNVIEELIRVTKPGGVLELVEMPFIIYDGGPQTKFYFQQVNMALKVVGHNANFGKALGDSLAVAGVEDVKHDYRSWPIGWGHPELGKYTKKNLLSLMTGLKPQISSTLNVSGDKYDQIIAEVNDELGERYQGFANIEVYIARKPGSGALTATLSK